MEDGESRSTVHFKLFCLLGLGKTPDSETLDSETLDSETSDSETSDSETSD